MGAPSALQGAPGRASLPAAHASSGQGESSVRGACCEKVTCKGDGLLRFVWVVFRGGRWAQRGIQSASASSYAVTRGPRRTRPSSYAEEDIAEQGWLRNSALEGLLTVSAAGGPRAGVTAGRLSSLWSA